MRSILSCAVEDHAGMDHALNSNVCALTPCRCVVAGRLANLDHNLQVMLIEAGESNLNNPWVS